MVFVAENVLPKIVFVAESLLPKIVFVAANLLPKMLLFADRPLPSLQSVVMLKLLLLEPTAEKASEGMAKCCGVIKRIGIHVCPLLLN